MIFEIFGSPFLWSLFSKYLLLLGAYTQMSTTGYIYIKPSSCLPFKKYFSERNTEVSEFWVLWGLTKRPRKVRGRASY